MYTLHLKNIMHVRLFVVLIVAVPLFPQHLLQTSDSDLVILRHCLLYLESDRF